MSAQERAALRAWRRADSRLWIDVAGASMAPLLRPGDRILMAHLPPWGPLPGAVVVVEDGGGLLTHRLVAIGGRSLILWGDAMAQPDPPLPLAAALGVAVARERNGRRLSLEGRLWAQIGRAMVQPGLRGPARLALRVVAASIQGEALS